ncbi:transcriptional repressor LexA [Butyricicoccus pullicaecorum]|uniref:LexA repressor n=2 Tax=Butyricicoccus pullicaecorum TaxID=501571 RepID=R8W9V9_9FIRM|nr:transcriptional repressor LexA [Butyricicoccus pullicaecorum]EOQ39932.1 repressor LexA [Butyricicoccus pullicaecorum 1.2]MBS5281196.1 transcriptional repressor LexA [Butyricicoccus pullicaecorum]MDY2969074.1 transcriptional repressor LexA [Butyricicoccus pullicaecorum]OUP57042.1 repressor LexA [Butyricicoccus pullicaecorum]SKA57901.1 repressor LexA [Butyricicoccus pullicaecorum DSM 23266]
MKKLSEKQKRILEYIAEATAAQGYPPSVREIGKHVGLSSSSSVHAQLIKLREKGYLEKDDHKTRALVVKGAAASVPQVPILGQVTAGMPILAVEDIEGYLPYEQASGYGEYFALRIKGDSMIGAGILNGDYIIVRQQNTATPGQIVVAMIEDEATCKTLKIEDDGHVWLMPENPDYSPIDGEGAVILGVVTALHRDYFA